MWPEGMVLVPFTYGPGTDLAWSRLTIRLKLQGADHLVFHGQPLTGQPPQIRLPKGAQGTFELPAVDQEGVTSPDGTPISFYAFEVDVEYIEGNTVTEIVRTLQPLSSDSETDLDSLPSNGTGIPEQPGGGGEPGKDNGFNYPLVGVTTQVIPHTLGRIPNVDIYELTGGQYRQVDADVTPTLTTVVLQFPTPFTGLAAIS